MSKDNKKNENSSSVKDEIKKLPKSLYRGELPIGDIILDCAVLEDGTRILTKHAVFKAFGRTSRGLDIKRQNEIKEFLDSQIPNNQLQQIPSFLDSKAILSLVTPDLIPLLQSFQYLDDGKIVEGYQAAILTKMCSLYLTARRDGILNRQQHSIANQAEILLSAFASVGLDALIDEATGYQYDRKHDALRMLLQKYLAEGLQPWLKTFPDIFFAELDRLYNNATTTSKNRPQYYGRFINTYIYDPIEDGFVKKELNKLNISESGKRIAKFHQWLSSDGKEILIRQMYRILGIMETSKNIESFKSKIDKQKTISIAPYIFKEMNEMD